MLKVEGCLAVVHKAKHVLCRYFPENWSL